MGEVLSFSNNCNYVTNLFAEALQVYCLPAQYATKPGGVVTENNRIIYAWDYNPYDEQEIQQFFQIFNGSNTRMNAAITNKVADRLVTDLNTRKPSDIDQDLRDRVRAVIKKAL